MFMFVFQPKTSYISRLLPCFFGQFLRALWEAVSWAIVLSTTLNKLSSQPYVVHFLSVDSQNTEERWEGAWRNEEWGQGREAVYTQADRTQCWVWVTQGLVWSPKAGSGMQARRGSKATARHLVDAGSPNQTGTFAGRSFCLYPWTLWRVVEGFRTGFNIVCACECVLL